MKLYMHPRCPNVRAVLMSADLLEVSLEQRLVDAMAGEQSTLAYLRVNPTDYFPHGGWGLRPIGNHSDHVILCVEEGWPSSPAA
jgi:hypothetical protein